MIRCIAGCNTWRLIARCQNQIHFSSSSSPTPLGLSVPLPAEPVEKSANDTATTDVTVKSDTTLEAAPTDSLYQQFQEPRRKGSLVAAAFASLKATKNVTDLEKLLEKANTVEEVLSLSKHSKFSRHNALKVVSVLADWAANNKVKLNDFESDPRFVQICSMLGRKTKENGTEDIGDLATVLGVTGDDEAAKLVSSISFSQKIRVLSSLARKKRRSIVLLRALSVHIGNSNEILDVKQAADVLYALAVLNFPDHVLLKKLSSDLCSSLPSNEKPAVVGSVLTSLGILRYKNEDLLDALADWIRIHYSVCRIQDLVALLLTLSSVNYHPNHASDLYKVVLPAINNEDVTKPTVWLDVVWALVVLNLVKSDQLQTVLCPDFVKKLTNVNKEDERIPVASQLKLLNLRAAAQVLVADYRGPYLSDMADIKGSMRRSHEKQILVDSVLSSLTNLLPSATYLQCKVDTGYGFFIDGVCALDSKCNPLPVEGTTSNSKRIRVAVMVCDYHDMCCGRVEPAGHVSLHIRLLQHQGYHVMVVPYTEFNPREKLVIKVKYLEQKLKNLVRLAS